ncbi:MAG TPA: DNA recombination protein RmuC [Candidatus Paceibacterota bacterium]|jgi:DNA recombination protein RmuC|nr:DNA recombination protein RmuC [Candidatus Paceibacterota bacterium]HOQ15289.1 DNA recombination protein RmuC [Candidatus Paceibacterota bacterium]HPQ22862.1 DNA recombination protein RmuC [Candidatus Paceibacterota bacterium]
MSGLIIFFGAIIIVLTIILIYFLFAFKKNQSSGESLLLLQNQILQIQNQIQEHNRNLGDQLNEANKVVRETIEKQLKENEQIRLEISKALARFESTSKEVVDYSSQLKQLQNILTNPKQRGVLGEYYLETVLKNVLPPNVYQMQYEFKDGLKVDAVIFLRDKIIPIDSKFSLENYNRLIEEDNLEIKKKYEDLFKNDLKNRIDETAKYIKPEEGTTEFAFMFIPSEAVYYDLLINKVGAMKSDTEDLIQYAVGKKRVLIVSPTTFFGYLQTVLQGLKALEIEKSAQLIKKRVEDLLRHLSHYEIYMQKLGDHLSTTVSMYNNASKEFSKIDKDVYRITGKKIDYEITPLDSPEHKFEEQEDNETYGE